MSFVFSSIPDLAHALIKRGMIPIPLCADSKQISFNAMGLPAYHTVAARKRFKDVAFESLCFQLAMQPPGIDMTNGWLRDHRGNLGIVAGYHGLIILDFDDKPAFHRWAAENPDILDTPIEETTAGFHVYLRCHQPIGCSSFYMHGKKCGHIKGCGGYVACAPSMLEGRQAYRWLKGKSPLDVEPMPIAHLSAISINDRSPLRRIYEKVTQRGTYQPDEIMQTGRFEDV